MGVSKWSVLWMVSVSLTYPLPTHSNPNPNPTFQLWDSCINGACAASCSWGLQLRPHVKVSSFTLDLHRPCPGAQNLVRIVPSDYPCGLLLHVSVGRIGTGSVAVTASKKWWLLLNLWNRKHPSFWGTSWLGTFLIARNHVGKYPSNFLHGF